MLTSQSRTVLCQKAELAGLPTQCPSSGKSTSFDSTPIRCTAVKSCSLRLPHAIIERVGDNQDRRVKFCHKIGGDQRSYIALLSTVCP